MLTPLMTHGSTCVEHATEMTCGLHVTPTPNSCESLTSEPERCYAYSVLRSFAQSTQAVQLAT
jgi:hypothetical protein